VLDFGGVRFSRFMVLTRKLSVCLLCVFRCRFIKVTLLPVNSPASLSTTNVFRNIRGLEASVSFIAVKAGSFFFGSGISYRSLPRKVLQLVIGSEVSFTVSGLSGAVQVTTASQKIQHLIVYSQCGYIRDRGSSVSSPVTREAGGFCHHFQLISLSPCKSP
jgi:hypothetical protein